MKKTIFINTAVMLLSSFAMAQTAVIGSGSDGLIQRQSKSMNIQDVEVPFPGVDKSQQVVVNGTSGIGQDNEYCVYEYKKNSIGMPVMASGLRIGCRKLYKGIQVNSGPIIVEYSGSYLLTEKKPTQPLVINLRKIKVPFHNGKIQFKVFIDFTSLQEQHKYILFHWVFLSQEFREYACIGNDPETLRLCQIINNSDFEAFEGIVKINHEAKVTNIGISQSGKFFEESTARRYVIDPKDGEFVSVLPGVYGIEWFDTDSESSSDTYGIVLK